MRRLLVIAAASLAVVVAIAAAVRWSVVMVGPAEQVVYLRDGEVIGVDVPGLSVRPLFSDYVVVRVTYVSVVIVDGVSATTRDGRECVFEDLSVVYQFDQPEIAVLAHPGQNPLVSSPLFETAYAAWARDQIAAQDSSEMTEGGWELWMSEEIVNVAAELGVRIVSVELAADPPCRMDPVQATDPPTPL